MIAAAYCRKSTEQTGVSDEAKSVARQIDHARVYAARKGWRIADEHIYVDDGISGAEFATRPGFLRLMNALSPRPAFQVVIMSEESRLGREMIESAYALKRIITAGVRVFFYLEDRERTLESPTDKIMLSLTTFADELERERARQRTFDALLRKAKAGHVTGGKVFGYDNVEVLGVDGKRSHVTRQINDAEAAVVRSIFERCAAGEGLTRITKALNDAGALTPRPQRGRPAAWATASVRDVLLRRLYAGEIVWNQTRKRNAWGLPIRADRPAHDWIRVPAPELTIVSPDLWARAHAGFEARQRQYGTVNAWWRDVATPYLLSGLARCAVCGGGLGVHSRAHGADRVHFYGCTAFWKRGARVCPNNLVGRMTVIDQEVLATLQDDVCRPAIIEAAIHDALQQLAPAMDETRRAARLAALTEARLECDRLAEAIGQGGPLPALLARLTARQADCVAFERELAQRPPDHRISRAGLEQRLRSKLHDWRGLLQRNIIEARDVLRALLIGPLRFTPIVNERQRAYAFDGVISLDRLLAGVVELPTNRLEMASPTGTDGGWQVKLHGISDLRAA